MSLAVILKHKEHLFPPKRLVLSQKALKTQVYNEQTKKFEDIYLKTNEGRPLWSKDDKKYLKTFKNSPFVIQAVEYSKIEYQTLSETQKQASKSQAYQYLMIHKKSGYVLSTKIVKKLKDPKKVSHSKLFGKSFDPKMHKVMSNPVIDLKRPLSEKDPLDDNLKEIFQNKSFQKICVGIIALWFISLAYTTLTKYFEKPEPTLVQLENKELILKKREAIKKLLIVSPSEKKVVKLAKPKPKSEKVNKPKSKTIKPKNKTQKVASGSTKIKSEKKTKVKKGKSNVTANRKSLKPSPKPSLTDSLFSRSLKKGRIGKAAETAKNTSRGSKKGSQSGKGFGSSSKVSGGFAKGSGKSLAASANSRGGSGRGQGSGAGSSGVGSAGLNLNLNGTGSDISGGLTREQINKVVRRNKRDITRCYETREPFNPGMEGQVSVNFIINGSGRVVASAIKNSSINDKPLNNCLNRKIATWKFDKPTNGVNVKVTYPFNFKSTNIGAL